MERRRRQPARLRDAARHRDLRPLGPRRADLVLLVATGRCGRRRRPGARRRRLRLHLRRADRGRGGDARGLPRARLSPHHLPARRRAAAGDAGAGRAGRRPLPDPPRQLTRQGRQHQRRAAPHRGRPGADARRRPRPDAGRARRDGRLFRRRADGLVQSPHDFFNHDSVQHYVVGRHEQSLFSGSCVPARTATAPPTGAARPP